MSRSSARASQTAGLSQVVPATRAAELEAAYAADRWEAERLGVPARRGRDRVNFAGISQPWLRDAVKRWARWRLATGCSFMTIAAGALALSRFSTFLAQADPDADETAITRPLIEAYLAWLAGSPLAPNTRSVSMIFLRGFLEDNRRFLWLPAVPSQAAIYYDDLPRRDKPRPRFVPEVVMAQLEAETNLAQLDPTTRNLVVLLIEAGLRAGDACTLAFDPLVPDSVGWPCLRFYNSKVGLQQVVPLSVKGVAAVRAQQDVVRQRWPAGSPWLFPDLLDNPEGSLPYRYLSLGRRLRAWEVRIGLHDEAGRPIRVTAHQLRHTLVISPPFDPLRDVSAA